MSDRKQQRQLIGYLLGALDDAERERIDERLAGNPDLGAALARVEESLDPLRAAPRVHQPPPGLAARTCRMVFAYSEALTGRMREARAVRRPVRERARAMSPAAVPPSSTATWGWSDLVVAVGVFLAIASVIFPAIQRSRTNMRLVSCQNNLRQIGVTQAQLQQSHAVPAVTAGVPYASFLREEVLTDLTAPQTTKTPRPVLRTAPQSLAGLGRGMPSAHQGFTQAVRGQNLLFLDGRVTFLAMGPIVDPAIDETSPDDPFAASSSPDGASPTPSPGDLAPIVLVSRPERWFEYNNPGIDTAGCIVEVAGGMPYEEFLDQRLIQPLGMKDTTFWPSEAPGATAGLPSSVGRSRMVPVAPGLLARVL